ncbi:hypothetical protein OMR07_02235 [Methylobacterium organophilum]|nr:hypothetical protein [Methylobacterium organophilum]
MGDEQRPEAAEPTTASATAARAEPVGSGDADVPPSGAAAPAADAAPVGTSRESADLIFELAKEVAYHTSREAWFGGLQRATLFINVGLGAGLLAEYIPATLAGFLVAMASAFDVTFDFAGQARRHRDLRGRFFTLAETAVAPTCNPGEIRPLMLRLDADAPPTYRTVEAVAYNQALTGLGRDPDYRLYVPTWQRLARHLWPFGGSTFESLRARRERLAGGDQ